jgi:acyl transferase domain-containing protein/NADPH:quinone reductase-like Zn-dependent oxidoreductase
LLAEGRSGIREIPARRWTEARKTLPAHLLLGGYLDDVDRFDAEFFGIAPREAHSIDPQQRLLLEVCWEALADGGIAPSALGGTETGVFVAVYNNDYARLQMQDGAAIDSHTGVGAAHSVAAGRLSFLLNLRGPCMAVDTACSSSLVAAHLACQSLRRRECHVAIVGGCSLKLLADEVRAFAQWGMLSSDGQAKTFDARADGFAPGEGCGVIVLRRLSDAVAQGDRIRGVIRGTAVNHDGRSSVLTAPSGPAQEAVIRAALRDGQVAAGDVSYVEAHGTGTSLGDPIEVEALDAVYGGEGVGSCVLGAAKTNLGHLEAAAGLAGLIKVVMALENRAIPRNLNFTQLNPQISLGKGSRLKLATEAQPWPRSATPRFAGVSSFGLGGTNAHLILEEAPVLPSMGEPRDIGTTEYCLPVSAHTFEALVQGLGDYAALLRKPGSERGPDIERIARTAARSRDHAAFRVAVTGVTAQEAAEKLLARAEALARVGQPEAEGQAADGSGKLAFVFSGQGSLWPGMLAALAAHFPEAEKTISHCEQLIQDFAGWPLRAAAEEPEALEDTAKAQPILFAMQMALVRVLENWGVVPAAVTGHSVGEVAAAVASGVLSLEEGMRLVLRRGARMAERVAGQASGRMLSAEVGEAEARALLPKNANSVELAAVNGPRSVVFAGPEAELQALAAELAAKGKSARFLDVRYAFHSAAMASAARNLEADLKAEFVAGLGTGRRAANPLISTVTGELWQGADGDAAYWARGIREPVRFAKAVTKLLELGCRTVVEIGPHPVLLRSVMACAEGTVPANESLATIAVMRRGQSGRATLMAAAGTLYERGAKLAWTKVYPGPPVHATLPPYRWNRQRYWLAERPLEAIAPINDVLEHSDLPSRELWSAFVDGRVTETRLGTAESPWLADHCFDSKPILPFTAWLEIARRAAGGDGVLREFAVHRRLELGAENVALQTLVTPKGEIKVALRQGDSWESVASGFWDASAPEVEGTIDLADFRARASRRISIEELYAELAEKGLSYGPAFRLLRSVYAGPGCALGEIAGLSVPGIALHPAFHPAFHPALLDACLQVVSAAFGSAMHDVAVLPVSVRSYRVLRGASAVFALAQVHEENGDVDVTIVDRAGSLVAEILGLRVRQVAAEVTKAAMWQVAWDAFVEAEAGQNAVEAIRLQGSLEEVTERLLAVVAEEQGWPGSVERICFVTRGAVAVYPGETVDPEQAALLGLARSFRAEYPAISVQVMDLPGGTGGLDDEALAGKWMDEAGHPSGEIALRRGRLLRPRLEKSVPEEEGESALEVGTAGLLETLHAEPGSTPAPGPDEVQIECRAHGLNFRDVLTALGNYAGVAAAFGAECAGVVREAGRAAQAGFDAGFAPGTPVVAFARDSMRSVVNVPVSHVVVKPKSMSFAEAASIPVAFLTAHYAFSRLAGLRAGQTVLIHSAAGGLGQAAVQLAKRAGATVIATAGSAEKRAFLHAQGIAHVFDSRSAAFADEVLHVTGGRGVDVVLNALSGERIAAGFRALATGGVFLEVGKRDIWSAGQAEAVRPDVRYWAFDLGDVSERQPELIKAMLEEIFAGFAAGELEPMPSEIYPMGEAERAFRHMASGRHVGKLVLVRPARPVAHERWADALRGGTVLITGGTGALGLATARWLLAQGARSLVLMSRRAVSGAAAALEAEFADARVWVRAGDVTDRAQLGRVLDEIRQSGEAPLRVVMHAAGEVDDRLFTDHSPESFALAMRTKVEGARLLQELTEGDDLVTTVYFSSAAALLGAAGQASYAAANAYLDGLAERRTALGLPTLSVNWGAWAEGGMVGQLSAASLGRLTRQGVQPMLKKAALGALGEAIVSGRSRAVIANIDWEMYRRQFPEGSAVERFFAGFLPGSAAESHATANSPIAQSDTDALATIREAARSEQVPRMEAFVRAAARKVLGLSAGRPMPGDTPMQEFGLDSLMALELRNVLAQAMGRPLSATLLFDYPSVRGLSGFLLGLMAPAVPAIPRAASTARPVRLEDDDLAGMSDAEAEELLIMELSRKGGA